MNIHYNNWAILCDRNKHLVKCINVLFQGLYECVSLCFHPFGVVLAAGSTEGHLVVLNAENGAPVVTIRVCGSPLNCLGYNPGNLVFTSYHHIGLLSDSVIILYDNYECSPSFSLLFV